MDVVRLREALASFLGDEAYWKFVRHLDSWRMRYWQEVAWGRFVSAHPEWAIGEDELRVALRLCWVHRAELLPETVQVVDLDDARLRRCLVTGGFVLPTVAEAGKAPEHVLYNGPAGGELSPWAGSTSVIKWTERCPFPSRTMVVWYCAECRQVYASEQPRPAPSIDWRRLARIKD